MNIPALSKVEGRFIGIGKCPLQRFARAKGPLSYQPGAAPQDRARDYI
jgi:hypothetical protein